MLRSPVTSIMLVVRFLIRSIQNISRFRRCSFFFFSLDGGDADADDDEEEEEED